MQRVATIDIDIYRCVAEDLNCSDVIITDERLDHIKGRHAESYNKYLGYLKLCIEEPDYIIEANKERTALVLKSVYDDGGEFKVVVKLVAPDQPNGYVNSVITFMRIRRKEWDRLIRNKKILYKRP